MSCQPRNGPILNLVAFQAAASQSDGLALLVASITVLVRGPFQFFAAGKQFFLAIFDRGDDFAS